MVFEPRIVEAKLTLNLIASTDMPALVWDAIEAGLDGPAIRRMAALKFPTYLGEMHLSMLDEGEAVLRQAKVRAQEILATNADGRP